MRKIVFIGAGSTVFAKNLLGDIPSVPELADATITLMDIDEQRLHTSAIVAKKIAAALDVSPQIEATTTEASRWIKSGRWWMTSSRPRRLFASLPLSVTIRLNLTFLTRGIYLTLGHAPRKFAQIRMGIAPFPLQGKGWGWGEHANLCHSSKLQHFVSKGKPIT